jgi:hypothetical protein
MTPACPFCAAADGELVSQFGGQLITAQWRCRACGSYFEAVREELGEPQQRTSAGGISTASASAGR